MNMTGRARSLLEIFVTHRNAANLLMVLLLLFGSWGAWQLNRQFFPTIDVPVVDISVDWSGASTSDLEKGIVQVIEPAVRFLSGVREMETSVVEGNATITLSYEQSEDMAVAEARVENAVNSLTNLPQDAQTPEISRVERDNPQIAEIGLSGPYSELSLRTFARQLRDGLLDAGLEQVDLNHYRPREIQIDLLEDKLVQLDLTLSDVADVLNANIADRPSGSLSGGVEKQLRALAVDADVTSLSNIKIVSRPTGDDVVLGDIARIKEDFEDGHNEAFYAGQRGIELSVASAPGADAIESFQKVEKFIQGIIPTLPDQLDVQIYNASAALVDGRLSLLINNGLVGLIVVLAVLFVFLDFRIAFWVAVGIPVAIGATLGLMMLTGQTLNMISMFALLMTLGIIVDDAIVVGEHTATRFEMGDTPQQAAINGAGRMAGPVIAASLTTVAAFGPLSLVKGDIGQIMVALPMVVVAVLLASLVECFFILPGHLSHAMPQHGRKPTAFRHRFDKGFHYFKTQIFAPVARLAYHWRYATIALALTAAILGVGYVAAGRIGLQFLPSLEGDVVRVSARFQPSVPKSEMALIINEYERKAQEVARRLIANQDNVAIASSDDEMADIKDISPLVRTTLTILNAEESEVSMSIFLVPSEEREVRTRTFEAELRTVLPQPAGVRRLSVRAPRGGPPGRDIDIELSGPSTDILKQAAEDLKAELEGFDNVVGISDSLRFGKPEILMELTPRGEALGFTLQSIGQQVRDAFEGRVLRRVADGDDEIALRLSIDTPVQGTAALNQLQVRTVQGQFVPLSELVSFTERQGFARILRSDGKTNVSIRADVDESGGARPSDVLEQIENELIPPLVARYGVSYDFAGQASDREQALGDLLFGTYIALGVMYVIISWMFGSYGLPFAVMLIIPFGVVGALWGHVIMGIDLTIVSIFGVLGLSGILVNDSIVLVSRLQERLDNGESLFEACIGASQDRLRAVLLTSFTTVGGLFPLLFETSLQAQFLIPMVITIVFGLAFATLWVLLLVPAFVAVGADIAAFIGWWFGHAKAGSFRQFARGEHHFTPRVRLDPTA